MILLGVNYRNPNQLAGGESPLFYLVNSYWSCKTQIILSLCEAFIHSFPSSRTFAPLFVSPPIHLSSSHKHLLQVYVPSTVLLILQEKEE